MRCDAVLVLDASRIEEAWLWRETVEACCRELFPIFEDNCLAQSSRPLTVHAQSSRSPTVHPTKTEESTVPQLSVETPAPSMPQVRPADEPAEGPSARRPAYSQSCTPADKTECGCLDRGLSDYRGTMEKTDVGVTCMRWENSSSVALHPNASLEENFCRNPNPGLKKRAWCMAKWETIRRPVDCNVPICDPCSCMPECGQPKNASCACHSLFQAEQCCADEDASCKYEHLKEACRISLESDSTDFCDEAEVACCQNGHPTCRCNMYDHICSESRSPSACEPAPEHCCDSQMTESRLNMYSLCDFYTYTSNVLGYESTKELESSHCSYIDDWQKYVSPQERGRMEQFYRATGGGYWLNNDGWLSETSICQWYGLTCNEVDLLTEIKLRGNNLTGDLFGTGVAYLHLSELTLLDLAENNLRGTVISDTFLLARKLRHIDISHNMFLVHADMSFPPAVMYANYSHNMFSLASFRSFNAAYETLQNLIDQKTLDLFRNMPPNLEQLILSYNTLQGPLPNPFPFQNMLRLRLANNAIDGSLPERLSLGLVEIDLSNQREKGGGLTGSIPSGMFKNLFELTILDLAGNKLTQNIPSQFGFLDQLKTLNLSSNALDQSIPSELGKLKDRLEVLDLSDNQLIGTIPLKLTNLKSTSLVRLGGNPNISNLAPLDLCAFPRFDLKNAPEICPFERSALEELFDSLKGAEWIESSSWLDPYKSHCLWYVICNNRSNTIRLLLNSNGLSGTLSRSILALKYLENLDLSDNDIEGAIITEIGLLSNLEYLRLSYNNFDGMEMTFEDLHRLKQVQLNGNQLRGTLPELNLKASEASSFVSDCGNPTDIDEMLYDILITSNRGWVEKMLLQDKNQEERIVSCCLEQPDEAGSPTTNSLHEINENPMTQDQSGTIEQLKEEMMSLKTLVRSLQESMSQAGIEFQSELKQHNVSHMIL